MTQAIKRQKAKKPVKSQEIIQTARMFREWGFMDYMAARILLMRAVEPAKENTLPKTKNIDELQKRLALAEHTKMARGIEVGYLLLPACALAATSIEKYFKAVFTLKEKKTPNFSHLDKDLINAAGNSVQNLFDVINRNFVRYLSRCYELRYFDNIDKVSQKTDFPIRPRIVLAELDFTVAEMEKSISITFSGGSEIPDSYQTFCQLRVPVLWQHNYVLQGVEKVDFLKQQDFLFRIAAGPQTAWMPHPSSSEQAGKDFFTEALQEMKDGSQKNMEFSSEIQQNLEAAIMHYFLKAERKTKK